MPDMTVRIGFVPTYRWKFTPWCRRMRDEGLAALRAVPGLELVELAESGDGAGGRPAGTSSAKLIDGPAGRTPFACVNTLAEAEAAAEFFASRKVEGLVLCPLDFGDERSVAKVAEMVRVPMLLYATKEPPAADDAGLLRLSDSYCGNLAVAAALMRRSITVRWAGLFFPDEAGLRVELERFVAAVSVIKGLRGAKFGQIGLRPPPFESVAYDELAMARKFGQNVIYTAFSEIDAAAEAIPADSPEVRSTVDAIRSSVAEVTVGEDYLLKAARMELAVAAFWERSDLAAMAVQCWPQKSGISMCALLGRLTGRKMLAACETDMLGAVSMLVSYRSVLGRSLPHLVDWTIQHREDPNRLLAWHCGNAPTCLARDSAATALRSRSDMKGASPPRACDPMAGLYQFQIAPGPVTLSRMAEFDGEWKMLITRGQIVPSDETLAGTWAWVEVADHARLYRTLVEEGFIHHASMMHGDQAAALELACKFLDVTAVVV